MGNDTDLARFRLIHLAIKCKIYGQFTTTIHPSIQLSMKQDYIRCCHSRTIPSSVSSVVLQYLIIHVDKHIVSACPRFTNERESFIKFISNQECTDIGYFLRSANMESFICALLGAKCHTCLNNVETTYDTFMYACKFIEFVSQTIRIYMKHGRPSISFSSSWCGCQCMGVQRPKIDIPQ